MQRPLARAMLLAVAFLAIGCLRDQPETPLAIAAVKGDLHRMQTLLDQGADRDEQDDSGHTALMWAARAGPPRSALLLLEAGADIDAYDGRESFGWTPLVTALHTGVPDTMLALIEAGADPDLAARDGWIPLHMAVSGSEMHPAQIRIIVKALLDHGADPRAANSSGRNVLTPAVANGDLDLVRMLMEAAPDLRVKDDLLGRLAIRAARLRGDTEILHLIHETED